MTQFSIFDFDFRDPIGLEAPMHRTPCTLDKSGTAVHSTYHAWKTADGKYGTVAVRVFVFLFVYDPCRRGWETVK
jgi:hypothetical protein